MIILLVIIGLTITSYSDVLVSDESIFTTNKKSDATFNNIQSRISIFENALDAKIDTYVYSYLSKNGIWNGLIQELETTDTIGKVGVEDNSSYPNQRYMYYSYPYYNDASAISKWSTIPANSTSLFTMGTYATYYILKIKNSIFDNFTLIQTITKSGLMHIEYDVQFPNSNVWNYMNALSHDSQICSFIPKDSYLGATHIARRLLLTPLFSDLIISDHLYGFSNSPIIFFDKRMQVIPSLVKAPAYSIHNIGVYMFVNKGLRIDVRKDGMVYRRYGNKYAVYRYKINTLTVY